MQERQQKYARRIISAGAISRLYAPPPAKGVEGLNNARDYTARRMKNEKSIKSVKDPFTVDNIRFN